MNSVLLTADGAGSKRLVVMSREEAAEAIGVELSDLTYLPFGEHAVLYMSRSAQRERDRAPNHSASLVAKRVAGLSVSLRGDVLSFPRGEPWRRLAR